MYIFFADNMYIFIIVNAKDGGFEVVDNQS